MRALSRRGLLIGGGAGVGLLIAWGVWPRNYAPNLGRAPDEHVFGAFVKIGIDGHVTVAVSQVEMGQGVYTTLPQILADELGADWRTVGVEPAPINPLYANTLFAEEWLGPRWSEWLTAEAATRSALMVTGGSTSVRGYEDRLRDAGAAARTLLCIAAAQRWEADWRACDTAEGFVTRGDDRLRFGELAAEAASLRLPGDILRRNGRENRLTGRSLPRLDVPAKVDGTASYAGDIRLPDMVYAAIAQGPLGNTRLKSVDRVAADSVPGVLSVVETERWAAAVAINWWAANRAVEAMRPTFETVGAPTTRRISEAAFEGEGTRIAAVGDLAGAFKGATVRTSDYRVGLAPHAAIEPLAATARFERGMLELWIGTQVPKLARDAAARAIGIDPGRVTVHPTLIGGSFGRRYEIEIAGQVAILAERLRRPVQLVWSRAEDMRQDRFRPAARARMAAKLGTGGRVEGWLAKIAAPATAHELKARVFDGALPHEAMSGASEAAAVAGAMPPYAIAHVAIDHHPVELGVPTGDWRGRAHGANAFFTECFIDELAEASGGEPFSYRMAMLGANPRLAQCLSKAAALGAWEGGAVGTGQGLACHSMAGSHVAVFAEADLGANGRVRVNRLVAVVDCGRVINPDVVKAQIAGGLIFGMSAATGAPVTVEKGLAGPARLGDLGLPRMADSPDILIELIVNTLPAGGVGEIAVPPVAPAIANALYAATGRRFRTLPLIAG